MKLNAHIKMLFNSAVIACFVFGYVSCVDDDEVSSLQNIKSDVVTFGITKSGKWEPDVIGRSADSEEGAYSRTDALPMDCDGDIPGEDIYMYMIVEDCPTEVDTMEVGSRAGEGEPVSSAMYGIYAFDVKSNEDVDTYDPGSASIFMSNIPLNEQFNYVNSAQTTYWPGAGHWLKFFAYTPYSGNNSGDVLTIDASSNLPKMTYTVPGEVSNQIDLMGGTSSSLYEGSNVGNQVEISLYHLLSQIAVKVGTIDVGTIKSVTFKNIHNKGSYTLGASEPKWTYETDVVTDYKQEGLTVTNTHKGNEAGSPFYFIPQQLHTDAEIVIELEVQNAGQLNDQGEGETQTFTLNRKLTDFTTSWSPDKKYTFVLSTPEEIEIEVSDQLSADRKIKSNLVIKNTGLSSCCIRASIVGSWVVPGGTDKATPDPENDLVVADWKFDPTDQYNSEKNDGTFVWGDYLKTDKATAKNAGWFRHTDGYYYYMKVLPRGEEADPLFETYSLTATPPVAGAVLDLAIVVQAVLPADVTNAWGSEFDENDYESLNP